MPKNKIITVLIRYETLTGKQHNLYERVLRDADVQGALVRLKTAVKLQGGKQIGDEIIYHGQ